MASKDVDNYRLLADNRKARYNYFIERTVEAGIMLTGTEVKGLRTGQTSIADSYAGTNEQGGLWLYNVHIPEYQQARRDNHEPRRVRKLLLRSKEITALLKEVTRSGMTLVPLNLYFNKRGVAKVTIGVARGKKLHDKRESEKTRDWNREKAKILRGVIKKSYSKAGD